MKRLILLRPILPTPVPPDAYWRAAIERYPHLDHWRLVQDWYDWRLVSNRPGIGPIYMRHMRPTRPQD